LLKQFGTPEAVFRSSLRQLEACDLPAATAQAIAKQDGFKRAEKELAAIRAIPGCQLLNWSEPEYPQTLLQIYDPPVLLYVRGDAQILNAPCLAVVGTRRPTLYGTHLADRLARDLAARGIVIVSGLARGIDAIAHQGAVTANGRAIGVLGTGVDICYPKENKKLYEKVLERGAILSEFPLSTHPAPENFPIRNRIVAGMPLGAIIIEGAQYSGSLITAPGDGIWPRSIRRARKRNASGQLRAEPSNQAGRQAGDQRRRCNRRAFHTRSSRANPIGTAPQPSSAIC
jgi:DNA processing protein